MTQTRDKLRSLFLTTLLVVSAVGGTVAFSGAAAAANSESFSFDPSSNDRIGDDVTYEIGATVTETGDLKTIEVDLENGPDLSDVDDGEVTLTGVISGENIQSVDVDGDTVEITLDGEPTINPGDDVGVEIDVTNENSGTFTADVDLFDNGDSSIDSFSVDYTIQGSSDRVRFDEADGAWASSRGPYWQGQELFLKNADDPNEQYTLREADGDDIEQFVSDVSLDENGEAIIDTGSVGGGQELEGEYVITKNGNAVNFDSNGVADNTDADVSDASIEVQPQSMSVEFEETTIRENLAEITFNSNRGGYDVIVSSDGLDSDELSTIFTNFTQKSADNFDDADEDDDIVIEIEDTDDTRDLDFSDIESDDYTFEFQVTDTTAEDDASITISQPEDAEAAFLDGGVYEVTQGGVVEIPIRLENADVAKINLGYDGQVYNETVEVEDDDDDDRVTLRVNTYLAGRMSLAEGDPTDLDDGDGDKPDIARAYSLADDDDEILSVSRLGDGIGSPPLADSFYDVNISVGDEELAVGAMNIQQAGDERLRSWTAPEQTFGDIDDREEFFEAKDEDELLSQDDTIAQRDTLIYQVESSSLIGAIDAETDDEDYAEGFATLLDDDDDVVEAGSFEFTFEQEDPDANRQPKHLDVQDTVDRGGLTVIPDSGNDSVYLIFDTDRVNMDRGDNDNDLGLGTDNYETNYTIGPKSGIPDEDEKITKTDRFRMVERELEFDTTNDRIEVRAEPGQLISGETTVAQGTEIRLTLRGTEDDAPFLKDPEITVTKGGNFSTLVDFSDQPSNTSFEAEANRFDGTTPGIILAARTASIEFADQSTFGTQVTVDSVETSDGGFVAIHRDSPSGEVIGSSDLIDNGTVENLEISINADLDDGTTLYAVPHFDEDGDGEFVTGVDPAYENNGTAVSASAEISIRTPTPTTTRPPTTTTEPPTTTTTEVITPNTTTVPQNDTTTTTTGPGLTIGLAVLALLGVALLAARREY